ncbi:MAG TPA: transporter [Bryobacteraceae bacterium]|nr:transporter [Bryobacteraceae bacterium]
MPGRFLTPLLSWCALLLSAPLSAQLPFYTDDPAVTEQGKWHFEFFNEFDDLQAPQYPNLRQNTANYKLNYGLPYHLEIDLDSPYLSIFRAVQTPSSAGNGDTNMGIKWQFHKESPGSPLPAMGVSFYIEFPTGDAAQQLGSGLTDYWLNYIVQRSLGEKTRINLNAGYLFAGNTSTGVLGLTKVRGHVFAGGLSLLHDFTPRLTLGAEVFGGFSNNDNLARSQLQALVGGIYTIRNGLALSFGVLGGKYVASPLIGGQVGFAVDFPDILRSTSTQ